MKNTVRITALLLLLILIILSGCTKDGNTVEHAEEQTVSAASPSEPSQEQHEESETPSTSDPVVSPQQTDASGELVPDQGEKDEQQEDSSDAKEDTDSESSEKGTEEDPDVPAEPEEEDKPEDEENPLEEQVQDNERPSFVPANAGEYIRNALDTMTLEEKVGQMFLASYPGYGAREDAADYHLGGYLFFASFFEERYPSEASDDIAYIQDGCDIPMFIAVDEEGGSVCRVSCFEQYRSTKFRSPRSVLDEGGLEHAREDCAEKSQLLLSLGVNMNLGPVCDVTSDTDAFMYWRSPGSDAETVCDFVSVVVSEMNAQGIGGALKHFPGYGNNLDTHTQIVYDYREMEHFEQTDFLPFKAAIEAGAGCIMVSHSIVQCMDPYRPASLSKAVNDILRNELGFDGVLMTDDISMSAVTDYTDGYEAAVMAVEAGNDLICCSDFYTRVPAVVSAVESGRISEDRIDQSVERILRLKLSLGIIEI